MDLDLLLGRCRAGDALAWEALVRRYQGRVFGLAYHLLGHGEDARDITQEVFVRLFEHILRAPGSDGFLPWLLKITSNAAIDHRRRRAVRPPAWDIPADTLWDLAADDPNPEQAHAERARKDVLHQAIQKLSRNSREVVVLKEIQGCSLDDIAALLGIPVGTVKSRFSRARIELAQTLLASAPEAAEAW